MKWRALLIPGIIILTTCVFVVAVKTFHRIQDKKNAQRKMAQLNSLPVVGLDSLAFSTESGSMSTVIIFFNAECEHCQNEATAIKKQQKEFSEATLLWVSSNTLPVIKLFSEQHKLNDIPNIHFTKIEPDKVFETFGSLTIPHIFIYNKDRRLVKEYKGEVKVEAILHHLQ